MECLAAAAGRYGVDAFYAFGSRGTEVSAWVRGHGVLNRASTADVDIGVLPAPGRTFDLDDRVGLAGDLAPVERERRHQLLSGLRP